MLPVLGFTAAVIDGAVSLKIKYATTRDGYRSGRGETQQFVMTPEAAVSIGAALIERGEMLANGIASAN
jgi:hypothetical protein